MSHFIQDNQIVVRTKDNKLMLFVKGGDNNVRSGCSNKRCSSWSIVQIFDSKESYNNFIDAAMMTDINGGTWQFQSLKNKRFDGATGYDATVYKRWDRALKKALYFDMSLEKVTIENIDATSSGLTSLFIENNFSIKDEDGFDRDIQLYSHYDKTEKDKLKRVRNIISYPAKQETVGYRDFCMKYEKVPLEEALKDFEFCRSFSSYRDSWNGLDSIKANIAIPKENFVPLMLNNIHTILNGFGEHDRGLFYMYPEEIKFVLDSTNLVQLLQEAYDKVDNDNWRKKSMLENLIFVKTTFIQEYDNIVKKKKLDLKDKISGARLKFVKAWNSLEVDAYYRNTNDRLPRALKHLDELFQVGDFTLGSIKHLCKGSFEEIPRYHNGQYKKNKKAIKDVFEKIIQKYSILIDDSSIDLICEYFDFEKPSQEIKTTHKSTMTLFDLVVQTVAS